MRLVADIGGTNARLALSEDGVIEPHSVRNFANDDWPDFYDLLENYLADHGSSTLTEMVIALAGPIKGDRAELTNRNWVLDVANLRKVAKCERVVLLNDLTALGYAVSVLGPDQFTSIHRGNVHQSNVGQSLVVGIGTGFNASPVVRTPNWVTCLSVEAGHVSMPISVAEMLSDSIGQSSAFSTVEALFSGRGFTEFCQIYCKDTSLQGVDVIAAYGKPDAKTSTSAVNQYAALLGQLLRELCLSYMPDSGVYLAGSVARAISTTAPDRCTEAFGRPCHIRSDQTSNLSVINDDRAALNGCAAYM